MSLIDCINAATKKGIIPNDKSSDLKKMFDTSFQQYKNKDLHEHMLTNGYGTRT